MGDSSRARRRLALGFAIASAGVAVWLVLGESDGSPGPSLAAVSSAGKAPPPGTTVTTLPPLDATAEELPEPVQRYLRSHAYPPTSGLLRADAVDLLEPNRRWERPKLVPDTVGEETEVRFLFTADRYYYNTDETVEARLEVTQASEPARVEILSATAQPESRGGAKGDPVALDFRARGSAQVADLMLSDHLAEHHGPVRLSVRFRYAEGRVHEDAIRIFVTPESRIPASFTGRFQDYVRDGSLVVEVGLNVTEAGFYRLDANAFDAQGAPVAFAAFKGELQPGESMVSMQFFGKAFREMGLAGPYTVEQLRGYRFLEGQYPDREPMRDFAGIWRTHSYTVEEFSDADFDSEHKRRMVELMMEDVRAGRSLDLPEIAADTSAGAEKPSAPESLVRDVEAEAVATADPGPKEKTRR